MCVFESKIVMKQLYQYLWYLFVLALPVVSGLFAVWIADGYDKHGRDNDYPGKNW